MDDNVKSRMEFAIEIKSKCCAGPILSILQKNAVKVISSDLSKQQIIVESEKTFQEVQNLIESTGVRAALMGQGSTAGNGHMGAAVAMINADAVKGVVRMIQINEDQCLFEGTLDGLSPGNHSLNIHEYGDLSDGCRNCGDHYNPFGMSHGRRSDPNRHVGDLGNIVADESGRSAFRFTDNMVKVWDVIGRSLVVHNEPDNFNKNVNNSENHSTAVGCAIIARSAGLLQNAKRICLCDGIPVWEERNVPNAGIERQKL